MRMAPQVAKLSPIGTLRANMLDMVYRSMDQIKADRKPRAEIRKLAIVLTEAEMSAGLIADMFDSRENYEGLWFDTGLVDESHTTIWLQVVLEP